MNNMFMALGGGNEIGASCYFLKLDDNKILLDCGARNNERYYPSFEKLIEEGIIKNFKEINAIIISHAHKDHFAALGSIANLEYSRIISTPKTKKKLFEMTDILKSKGFFKNETEMFSFKHILSSIATYGYFEQFSCGDMNIMFVPAGHIEGAAITVINYKNKKIVYTGDISFPLSDDENFFDFTMDFIKDCDVLIMENTYGYYSNKLISSSKHAQFQELLSFIKIVYPKEVFLVHHNDLESRYDLKDVLNEEFPTIRVKKIKNK
ncbi:MAG: MBL fold metallo-hydrolase, partial [Bacilli bacterium]|nr:MBL fold metallo-hydrolase [Bacilli bacterium]